MVGWNFGRRLHVSENTLYLIAALPVLAFVQFAFIAPASAHRLHHNYGSRHHAAMMVSDNAAPGFHRPSEGFSAHGFYNYAPAAPEQNGWRLRSSRGRFSDGGVGASAFSSFGEGSSYDSRRGASPEVDSMAASAASTAGIPASLVARVIKRESGGNPRAVSSGNYGLMQIRLGTARAMGYTGSTEGLLDAQTNMTYAVKYLAGAYRAAGGNEDRAVALYARGYHDVAKAQDASSYQMAQAYAQPGYSSYGTARSDMRRSGMRRSDVRRSGMRLISYRHVADAGTSDFGFASGPQFVEQSSFGYGEPAYRMRHHRRRGV